MAGDHAAQQPLVTEAVHPPSVPVTLRTGQTHVHRYMPLLLERILRQDLDPSFIITHRLSLDQAPEGYKMFRDKSDGCIKVVMRPERAPGVSVLC